MRNDLIASARTLELELDPRPEGISVSVVVGSACSGHGFKFGPVSGRRIAARAIEVL